MNHDRERINPPEHHDLFPPEERLVLAYVEMDRWIFLSLCFALSSVIILMYALISCPLELAGLPYCLFDVYYIRYNLNYLKTAT